MMWWAGKGPHWSWPLGTSWALLSPLRPLCQLLPHSHSGWHMQRSNPNSFNLSQLLSRETETAAWVCYSYSVRGVCSEGTLLGFTLPFSCTLASRAAPCFLTWVPVKPALCPAPSNEQYLPLCSPDHPSPHVWSQHLIENWISAVACDDNEPFMSQFEKAFETPVFISNYR